MRYESPAHGKTAYTCPFCSVLTTQEWGYLYLPSVDGGPPNLVRGPSVHLDLETVTCSHCHEESIWYKETMLYPAESPAPMPHEALPADMRTDYMEARDILIRSPRGAAALLRLVVQKVVGILGGNPKDIDTGIEDLVQQGKIDVLMQQGLDSVRVIGGEAVHPGELDLRDDVEIATALFAIVNEIVDEAIARPARRQAFYEKLPRRALKAIAERPEKRAGRPRTERPRKVAPRGKKNYSSTDSRQKKTAEKIAAMAAR